MLKRFHNKQNQSSIENTNMTYAQIKKNTKQKQENYYQRHHQQSHNYTHNEVPLTL